MTRSVRVRAPAKVNLTLEVLGRRADGYHELRSVMAKTWDLADDVRVQRARALDVRISPPLDVAPGDDLGSRAVRELAAASGREPHAFVRIRKRIPVAAGLGGGSSDAAAVLRGLARAWGVSAAGVAERVGSDVPFLASDAAFALVSGRGERVDPLPATDLWIVLVRVGVRVRTADVFGALRDDEHGDGRASASLAQAFADRTVTPAIVREHARNDLLTAAERCEPRVAAIRARAHTRGIALHLSGSGPSLFAIADDRAHALRLVRSLRRAEIEARAVRLGIPERPSALLLSYEDGSEVDRHERASGRTEGREEHRQPSRP